MTTSLTASRGLLGVDLARASFQPDFTFQAADMNRLSVDSALAKYRSSRLPFVAVLESATALYDDLAARLTLMASHAELRATLDEASLSDQPPMASSFAPGSGTGSMAGKSAPAAMPGSRE